LPWHVPVLPTEVLHWLNPQPGETFVDATLGAGGHARLLAERLAPGGRLIGLDQDPAMLRRCEADRWRSNDVEVTLLHRNFDQLRSVLDELGIERVDGVLADLGFASDQMEDAARGLSFQREGPLDMRLNPEGIETAADLIADLSERDLADLFWKFGEERHSRRIARSIVETRKRQPIRTTTQLAELIRRCVHRSGGIDPATRVFQALRIAVNDELGALDRLLAVLPECVKPGGRAAIISFHSLEDRLVKRAFRNESVWRVLTKKPVTATEDEVRRNPRSRSAKLRAARRQETGDKNQGSARPDF
jgi:16S rRNA (cytosine1402-N4)-methyltransferase